MNTNASIPSLQRQRLEKRLPLGAPDSGRRYELGSLVGQGGQGDVYRGHDIMLDRPVAVKFLRRNLMGDRNAEARIVREARLLAHLNAPGTPIVHDIDRSVIGCPFFAMSLIEGVNLRQVLHEIRQGNPGTQSRFALERLVDLMRQVADILANAHRSGIVHRDVKPENILVDPNDHVWLIDWGSADIMEPEESDESTSATTKGQVFHGSPAYAAPEQVRGEKIDCRTDVYGLGAVLYDCLALDTLIQAESRQGAIQKVVSGDQAPPSSRTLRRSVPEQLERVCMQAISRDPADRFENCESFSAAIRDGLNEMLIQPNLDTAYEVQNATEHLAG